MRPVLSPQEMAAADRATIDAGTPDHVLMERAGREVARAVIECAGGRYGRRVVVVCGKGNNGGDGFVAARIAAREGLSVRCVLVCDPDDIKGAAARHLAALQRSGIEGEPFSPERLEGAHVIVDAIFGTGFRGRAEGRASSAIIAINDHIGLVKIVAVDIPSGVDGGTGAFQGPVVQADMTIAMAAEKIGTAMPPGAFFAGRVEVAEIGIDIPRASLHGVEASDVFEILPHRAPDAHKRSGGSIAILGGAAGMSGAVVLAARAAVRAGVGYVTAVVTPAVERVVSVAVPEVLTAVGDDAETLGPGSLDNVREILDRADAIAVGPGLGRGTSQTELVERVLADVELPVVLDADGLNVIAGRTESLAVRRAPTVITPHPAELARLLDTTTEKVQGDRLASARAAAERFDCIVVLKGNRTLIARPDGDVVINPAGGPELATAGTGDVLTGVIAALLASGAPPFEAALAGAFVHGTAGSVAAREKGVTGVVAGDVADALPAAIEELRRVKIEG